MVSRSAAVRMIRPEFEDPEILHLEVPEGEANDMAVHAATIGAMLEKLAEVARKSSAGVEDPA